jgi:carboxymethylenebutenolidase
MTIRPTHSFAGDVFMPELISSEITFTTGRGSMRGFLARPDTPEPVPGVIVIHEIYGLTGHHRDVAARLARQGYAALAPDLFSRPDLDGVLTSASINAVYQFAANFPPEQRRDPVFLQAQLASLSEGQRGSLGRVIPLIFGPSLRDDLAEDLAAAVAYLKAQSFISPDRIGSVGFCFGGGISIRLACVTPLAACAVFYGENPEPIERVERIAGPVLGVYGAEDLRINQYLDQLVKAMVDYKKDFEMRIYPGAGHAFFNDTNPATYRPDAAADAWERLLRFYARTLAKR